MKNRKKHYPLLREGFVDEHGRVPFSGRWILRHPRECCRLTFRHPRKMARLLLGIKTPTLVPGPDIWDRVSELIEARVQDLKTQMRETPVPEPVFPITDSVQRLRQRGDSHRKAIALITAIPPAPTGVGIFSLRAFAASLLEVDVFAPFTNSAEYLGAPSFPLAGQNMAFYAAQSIRAGCDVRNYRAVIWVMGNSDDFIPVLQLLRSLRHLPERVPTWIEIHDPCLLNITSKVARLEKSSLRQLVTLDLGEKASGLDWNAIDWGDHTQLLELGFMGIRTMLNDVPLTGLIVHSQAAKQIVQRDWPTFDEARLRVLFHPLFEPYAARNWVGGGGLRIGTFGVAGDYKQTELIIEAFRIIRAERPEASLLLAGYHVGTYARDMGLLGEPGILVKESPSDFELLSLMASVDVAVQLRWRNMGESSGVIPQLLSLDVPLLTSPIGAMQEYGEAVGYVPVPCDAHQLTVEILREAQNQKARQAARAAYAKAHTSNLFCSRLIQTIREWTPPAAAAEADATSPASPTPKSWRHFEKIAERLHIDQTPYIQSHMARYRHTLAALETWMPAQRGKALDLGTTWLFAVLLKEELGFETVEATIHEPDAIVSGLHQVIPDASPVMAFNIDLESEPLPVEDARYDLVLCCEVLEHLDVDPMFMLAEINRTLKIGGRLLLTTPNVTSSRNVAKILEGYAPHFFMQYHKDRSPYRHNIEYAPDQVAGLLEAAGFHIDRLWTADTFEPRIQHAVDLLHHHEFPETHRGDNMFAVATKVGAVIDRHPSIMYV
jgi:SAM-dependent methyltransferase